MPWYRGQYLSDYKDTPQKRAEIDAKIERSKQEDARKKAEAEAKKQANLARKQREEELAAAEKARQEQLKAEKKSEQRRIALEKERLAAEQKAAADKLRTQQEMYEKQIANQKAMMDKALTSAESMQSSALSASPGNVSPGGDNQSKLGSSYLGIKTLETPYGTATYDPNTGELKYTESDTESQKRTALQEEQQKLLTGDVNMERLSDEEKASLTKALSSEYKVAGTAALEGAFDRGVYGSEAGVALGKIASQASNFIVPYLETIRSTRRAEELQKANMIEGILTGQRSATQSVLGTQSGNVQAGVQTGLGATQFQQQIEEEKRKTNLGYYADIFKTSASFMPNFSFSF